MPGINVLQCHLEQRELSRLSQLERTTIERTIERSVRIHKTAFHLIGNDT